MTTRSRICYGLSSLIVTFIGCGCGGAPSNVKVCNEPTFSKLAGRWSTSVQEMWDFYDIGFEDWMDSNWVDRNERIVFVTIRPDGTFDWSRSLTGVFLSGLAEVGDECRLNGPTTCTFRAVAANYTPTSSSISIERVSNETDPDMDNSRVDIELKLNSDGSATLRNPYAMFGEEVGIKEKSIRLRPHDRGRYVIANNSRLAGKWCNSPTDRKAILIIQEDGSFDWSCTPEAFFFGFLPLVFEGDTSAIGAGVARCKLQAVEYRPERSRVLFEVTGGMQGKFELVASRINDMQIATKASLEVPGEKRRCGSRLLHRNEHADERGSVFQELLEKREGKSS